MKLNDDTFDLLCNLILLNEESQPSNLLGG